MTPWLVHELRSRDLDVTCLDARHARAALKMQINETDQNDAEGLAQIMRTGWYRQVIRGPSCPRAACCSLAPGLLYRGFKSMTFWHGFASLPCSIPDGNGYRPRFKPVSVGSIRQYISQLLLARTNRGTCGRASGLARQSPDRQQSIDRTAGWRGSPAVRAHRSSKPWCGNASRNSRNVTCHGSSGRSIDHQDPDHDARSEGTGGVSTAATTRAGELLNGRYAGLGRPVNTCSLSMCASAKGIEADQDRSSQKYPAEVGRFIGTGKPRLRLAKPSWLGIWIVII